jgi:hypothetical protein
VVRVSPVWAKSLPVWAADMECAGSRIVAVSRSMVSARLTSGCGLAAGALLPGQGPRSACVPKLGNVARPPSSWPASVS